MDQPSRPSEKTQARPSGLSPLDPFATPIEERRLDRRFRGQLVAPVTVWTAGSSRRRAGLTVSSVLVAEGDPAEVLGLIDPLSELFDVLVEQGSFAIHVLGTGEQRLAGIFAGAYPVDALDEVEMADGEFGPIIPGARHRLGCHLLGSEEVGFAMLVRGRVDALEVAPDASSPLVRYRGRYRRLQAEDRGFSS
jgi:flavin reductase (DIM6/NTAB) family NADH-FMN oxidoreductase RutF